MTGSPPIVPGVPVITGSEVGRTLALGRGRRIRRLATRVFLVLAAIALALLAVRWVRARGAAKPPSYVTASAARGELTVTVTATGTLEARNLVEVGSEVSGRLLRRMVDFNDRVKTDQVLAVIDPETFTAQAQQARAALAQARAQLVNARATQDEAASNRAREVDLYKQGVVSAQERDAAVAADVRAGAAVALATAAIAQAAATVRVSETNLRRTVIKSPIDGVVLDRTIEAGQTVVAAFQTPVLFRIAEDLHAMKVSVDVDEADVGMVREGQAATFTVAAYLGREFPARVRSVHNAARLVDRVVSYEAELDVDNPDLLLRPGMTVTALIVAQQVPDALLVPSQALRFTPSSEQPSMFSTTAAAARPQPQVWVMRAGAAVAVPVTTGPSNETHTQILGGALAPGDAVIVNEK